MGKGFQAGAEILYRESYFDWLRNAQLFSFILGHT
jgi:hypothetical protein